MAIEKSAYDIGYSNLSPFQNDILWEAFDKKNGGLALPMGSGKTLIAVVLSLLLKSNGPVEHNPILVVAAKSLISSWVHEIDKFFKGSLRYVIFHTEYTKLETCKVKEFDIVLITPETISKYYIESHINTHFERLVIPERFGPTVKHYNKPDEPYSASEVGGEQIFSTKWSVLIIDESQTYYNIKSARCLGMAAICAHNRWLLSGTMFTEPRDHKILGYHLLLNHPEMPRNLPEMTKMIRTPTYKGTCSTMVIRDKNDDYEDISNINSEIISHPLTREEGEVYISIKTIIKEIKSKLDVYKKADDKENVKRMSSYMLGMISYLRQCLVCPMLAVTTVAINVADYKCKSHLARHFLDNINKLGLKEWLDDENSVFSSRLRRAIDLINKHKNERILVFSCYRTILDILDYYIPKNRGKCTINAGDKIKDRNAKLDKFSISKEDVLLLTYQIGSNGLNLQAASVVIILDFWFNAGVTDQAIARMIRRGQTATQVFIYYFTSNTGLENSLFKIQQSKIKIAKELLKGPVTSKVTKMSASAIAKMVNVDDNIEVLDTITK